MDWDGEVVVEGEVLEVERPKRLVMTWHFLYDEEIKKDPSSRVTFEIDAMGEVCKLTLMHDGFAEETKTYQGITEGWSPFICSLKSLLETGEPLHMPEP